MNKSKHRTYCINPWIFKLWKTIVFFLIAHEKKIGGVMAVYQIPCLCRSPIKCTTFYPATILLHRKRRGPRVEPEGEHNIRYVLICQDLTFSFLTLNTNKCSYRSVNLRFWERWDFLNGANSSIIPQAVNRLI